NVVVHENRRVQMWNNWCARTYLAVLLVSLPLAVWFLVKRNGSENLTWAAFFVVYFYSANFGNVFGISIVHTMEVWRYSAVQFIAALFAQLWAVRWLIEIALIKRRMSYAASREPRSQRLRFNTFGRRWHCGVTANAAHNGFFKPLQGTSTRIEFGPHSGRL